MDGENLSTCHRKQNCSNLDIPTTSHESLATWSKTKSVQELGHATIIGQTSAGKALPSVIKSLANGDRFQYVVADLIKPSGGRFEEAGVTPDVIVTRTLADYQQQRDPELEAAIAHLTSLGNQQTTPENNPTDP